MVGTAFLTGGSGFAGGHLIERLVREGRRVCALARSDAAANVVAARGAAPVRGDLASAESVRAGAAGAEIAFHAAAMVGERGSRAGFVAANVTGTANVLAGTRGAGVRRLVHVSTEAVLMDGRPLVRVDETAPLQPASPVHYVATKAMAEQLVRTADDGPFESAVAGPLASVAETLWTATRATSAPPLTGLRYWLSAQECTIDIARARTDLGYAPVVTRDDGLAALAAGAR